MSIVHRQVLINLFEPSRANFVSVVCYSLDYPLSHQKTLKPSNQLLGLIAKNLKLGIVRELAFAAAATNSTQNELRKLAESHLKQKINEWFDKVSSDNKVITIII